jgi:hypothetical protein
MAILEWPGLSPVDQRSLCTELDSLIRQVMDQQMHALDTLDDLFARMAAALLALLELHEPDEQGYCPMCPDQQPPCAVLHTVHEYLKAPLALVWWHELHRRGNRLSIDEVGVWLAMSEVRSAS